MIRPARIDDAPAIADIWNTAIRDSVATFTTKPKYVADIEALIKSQPVWIAKERTGFASYGPFRPGPGYAKTAEHSIYLSPEHTGKGLGRLLMDAVETHASGAGLHCLIAGLSGENRAAIAFHSALGFQTVGRIAEAGWKFNRWHDLVLMQKFL
ncbi:MAG: N-acetyltransferase family protein [Pseudomonadota bacterium]